MEFAVDTLRPPDLRRRGFDWSAPYSIAMVLLLAVLALLPMFWLLVTSLSGEAKEFTLHHYGQLFTDPSLLKPLLTTVWTSAAVGVACVLTAAPMSWLVARADLRG